MPIYVFDPVGNLPANLVNNESAQVNTINGVDHNYIIPLNAPFYGDSLVVVDEDSGQQLTPGTDFELTHEFREMSDHVNKDVFGSFTFTDVNRTGNFRIRYRTIGGDFVNGTTQALTDGLNALATLRNIDWDTITNVPSVFPPSPHTHPVTDVESVQQLITALQATATAIQASSRDIHMADIVDLNTGLINPLFQNLQNIATEIRTKSAATTIYAEQTTPGTTTTNLGPVAGGTWEDLPLQITPASGKSGTFEITHSVDLRTTPQVEYEVRFVINNSDVAKSYINGALVGLDDTMTVKVQVRLAGNVTDCLVADTDHSSALTIKHISN